jgi:hypothetical protein
VIDEAMPEAVHYLGIYGLILVFTVFTVSAIINEFFAFGFALFSLSFLMLYLYLPAATQLKKMVSSNSGALVGLVTETLEGFRSSKLSIGSSTLFKSASLGATGTMRPFSTQNRSTCGWHSSATFSAPAWCWVLPCLLFSCVKRMVLPPSG